MDIATEPTGEVRARLVHTGLLTAAAVHEVNNLVCALRAHAEIGLTTGSADVRRSSLLAIREATEDMGAWFRGLLDYAKGEDDGGPDAAFDPADAIEQALRLLRPHLMRRRMTVRRQLRPAGLVTGPAARLRQVLVNLLLNSAQAMKGGGEIAIRLRPRGHDAEIVLTDDGPGLPADVATRLFEPFPADDPRDVGAGLGLFVTKTLVASMGGHIEVRSRSGTGTRFTIRLPRSSPG